MSAVIRMLTATSLLAASASSQAAISLDRTRAIFPGTEKSITLNISNENPKKPYLAQAWLENENGQKISSPFMVVPPVQRLEPGQKSVLRVNALPAIASLPQDRESVFWFSIREIPPKSDRPNVMQIALQTRIKMFYRPAAILPEKYSRWDDRLVLHRIAGGYRVENPTPYFMTIIAITDKLKGDIPKDFKPVMIAPKSSAVINSKDFASPWVATINDFGGKPALPFRCEGDTCHAVLKTD